MMFYRNCKEFEKCFSFYEKAIEGRNSHYNNYNTWANYYAIFNGALFVGYYNVIKEPTSKELIWLSLIIVFVGLFTSICWHQTVKGHYHWMLSWIKIVQKYEEELAKIAKKDNLKQWRVYSVYINNGENPFQKNISSQKLTSRFTLFVEIAWSFLAIYTTYQAVSCFECCKCCCKLMCVGFSTMLVFIINVIGYLLFSEKSDTSGMKDYIC